MRRELLLGPPILALVACASAPPPAPLTQLEINSALESHLGGQPQITRQAEPPAWAQTPGVVAGPNGSLIGVGRVRTKDPSLGNSIAELRARSEIVNRLESIGFATADGVKIKLAAGVLWRSHTIDLWWDGDEQWAARVELRTPKDFLGAFENDPSLESWAKGNVRRLFFVAREPPCFAPDVLP